jgi:hypothetical protein
VAWPWVKTVRPKEANATEGAAPNSPAKVFGLKRSEISENAETTSPPMQNRISRSDIGSSSSEGSKTLIGKMTFF